MKRQWKLFLGTILVLLVLAGGLGWYWTEQNFGISTGRCIVTETGTRMILLDGSPVTMSNRSRDPELLDGLQTGDEIRILHDGIQETLPGKTGVYSCKLLNRGSIGDIPAQILEQLTPMGWAPVDDTGWSREIYRGTVLEYTPVHSDAGNLLLKLRTEAGESVTVTVVSATQIQAIGDIAPGDLLRAQCRAESSGYLEAQTVTEYRPVSYSHDSVQMYVELPAGWDYEIVPYEPEAYAFGIHFWPSGQAGKLRLEYYPGEFGVCGTGLVQEKIRLDNGLHGWIGTYDEHPTWDFITLRQGDERFRYAVCAEGTDTWPAEYLDTAMEILNRMTLAEK